GVDRAAGVDPGERAAGHVDDVVALLGGDLAGPHATAAAGADHVVGAVSGELVEPVGDLAEWHQHRSRYASLRVLVGLAHVDQRHAAFHQVRQLVDRDLGNRHPGQSTRTRLPARVEVVGGVDVAQ